MSFHAMIKYICDGCGETAVGNTDRSTQISNAVYISHKVMEENQWVTVRRGSKPRQHFCLKCAPAQNINPERIDNRWSFMKKLKPDPVKSMMTMTDRDGEDRALKNIIEKANRHIKPGYKPHPA